MMIGQSPLGNSTLTFKKKYPCAHKEAVPTKKGGGPGKEREGKGTSAVVGGGWLLCADRTVNRTELEWPARQGEITRQPLLRCGKESYNGAPKKKKKKRKCEVWGESI